MASARQGIKRALAVLPFVVPAALLAWIAIGRIYVKVGHAAASLDDAYIHFQYARAFAEGHPLRYHAAEPFSSGATSLLWPAVLAPFWLLGLRDANILWAAWGISFAALGALAYDVYHLTRPLAGAYAAIGASAMVFAFSGFSWCAASGMEVVPFAWMVTRSVRASSEWVEAGRAGRTVRARRVMLVLATALPLLRPEGAVFSALLAVTLAVHPREATNRDRSRALFALASMLAIPIVLALVTGSARSSTMQVKLLPGNPYYPAGTLFAQIAANARVLVGTLLNGEAWSQEFLPKGGAPLAMGGLVAILALGRQRGRSWRAASVLLIALTMFVPCAYDTFLWNRLRYLWPFAPGWLIGAACAAEIAGGLLAGVRSRWKLATPIACGIVAGVLAMRLDWTLEDAADSASGIDRQQVALGRWVKRELPIQARIGVNDTGAIAYHGERRTFDVVGLTTPGEAKYWLAGPGSRLEHYEDLARTSPLRLPTHFIVYPEWMACDAVLGQMLTEAIVTDATILGGQTMRAYEADYSHLGTGESPWSRTEQAIDVIDVCDLSSEAAHAYDLAGAAAGEQVARMASAPDGRTVVDGGRTRRTRERFQARMRLGTAATLVARVDAQEPTRARVKVDGVDIGAFDLPMDTARPPGDWVEVELTIPSTATRERVQIELTAEPPLTVFHYWVL